MSRRFSPHARFSLQALALVSVLTLGACDADKPPATPAPAAVEAASPAAAAVPAARPAVLLSFSADDGAIGTEVGTRLPGAGIATSGQDGWLIFGPYAPLPAGNYQVAIQGLVEAGHAGPIHVDVARDKGNQLIAVAELEADALAAAHSADGMVVLPFVLEQDVPDIEVRIRVSEKARLSIASYQIQSVP